MKVSHEVPLCLLDESVTFNDFHYLLPHYYEKYPKYRDFYIKNKDGGIILDNGLFEGGVLPDETLLKIITEVQPNIFIAPDAWNDSKKTYEFAKEWYDKFYKNPTDLMVVLQGTNYAEIENLMIDCLKLGIKHFALNHSSIAYQKMFPNSNSLISGMMGRILIFQKLIEDDIFDDFKNCYIHFLGVNLPQEVMLLGDLKKHINSLDTSNPVISGAMGWEYSDLGLLNKPKEKIEFYMEKSLALKDKDLIFKNIFKFRSWV